jgi:plasmid stabilization system protein ParE
MRIRWTVPAAEDLEGIKNYLESHYPDFAEAIEILHIHHGAQDWR